MALIDQITSSSAWGGFSGAAMGFLESTNGKFEWRIAATIILGLYILWTVHDAASGNTKGILKNIAIMMFLATIVFAWSLRTMILVIIGIFFVYIGINARDIKSLSGSNRRGMMISVIAIWLLGMVMGFSPAVVFTMGGLAILSVIMIFRMSKRVVKGTKGERRARKAAGFKPRKEQKMIKALKKQGKPPGYIKDVPLRKAAQMKAAMARREAENLELLGHEEAIAAATKIIGDTLKKLENGEITLEQKDKKILDVLRRKAIWLEKKLKSVNAEEGVTEQDTAQMRSFAQTMFQDFNTLIENRNLAEKYRKKAMNYIMEMNEVLVDASTECTKLRERKKDFKELRKSADAEIKSAEGKLRAEHKSLQHIKPQSKAGQQEMHRVRQRIKVIEQANSALEGLQSKLDTALKYLAVVFKKHNKQLNAMAAFEENQKKRTEKFKGFKKKFDEQDKGLASMHKKFKKKSKDFSEQIPDAVMITMTDDASLMFDQLIKIGKTTLDFNQNNVSPFIQESADAVKKVFFMTKVARILNKVYMDLAKSFEEITKITATFVSTPKTKSQLEKILKAEEFEEKEAKIAARRGFWIQSGVKGAYKDLNDSVGSVQNHVKSISGEVDMAVKTKEDVIKSLKHAFDVITKAEIKREKKVAEEALAGAKKAEEAKKLEKKARRAVRKEAA